MSESEKGFGHINRCIPLTKGLVKKKFHVEFLINKNKNIEKILDYENIPYRIIPKKVSIDNESKYIKKIIDKEKIKILILDMREYNERISSELSNYDFKTIVIDDAWSKKAYADLVINVTKIKSYTNYKKINKNCKICIGPKFYIISREFKKNKKNNLDIKKKKKYNITISLGGWEPDGLSKKILKSIIDINNINIKIIWGPLFPNSQDITKYSKKFTNVKIEKKQNNLSKIFKHSDIVISNGGNTLHELAILGIPCLAIAAHNHQLEYIEFFSQKGFCDNLGYYKELKMSELKNKLGDLLNNQRKRKKMNKNGQKIIDGKGLERTLNQIIKCVS
jgi:UDP-2,4-diacetamido-2,4,6-trideoxy-beta-L-altropyranose hydrolase